MKSVWGGGEVEQRELYRVHETAPSQTLKHTHTHTHSRLTVRAGESTERQLRESSGRRRETAKQKPTRALSALPHSLSYTHTLNAENNNKSLQLNRKTRKKKF